MAAYDIPVKKTIATAGVVAVQTCLKSNEPAIRHDHYQLHQNYSGKDHRRARSITFVDYKPKYFSRRDKSAKSTYFMKISIISQSADKARLE